MSYAWSGLRDGVKIDLRTFKTKVKWKLGSAWPRFNKRVSKYDVWCLDEYLAEVILSGVKRYYYSTKDSLVFDDEEGADRWNNDMLAIIEGFQVYIDKSVFTRSDEDNAKWEQAKRLLMEHWEGLWI